VTALNAGERQVAEGADGSTLYSAARGNPLAVSYPERRLGADHPTVGDRQGHQAIRTPPSSSWNTSIRSKRRRSTPSTSPFRCVRKCPPPPGAKPITARIKTIRPSVAEIDKGIPDVIEQWRDTFGN